MNDTGRNIKTIIIKYRFLIIAAVSALALSLAFGVTYSRYSTSVSYDINLEYNGAGQTYILGNVRNSDNKLLTNSDGTYQTPQGWTTLSAGSYSLNFLLANGNKKSDVCRYDQNAKIEMFVSEGIGSIGNISVSLTADGVTYTPQYTEVGENSPLYASKGAGWVAVFRDSNGNELSCNLAGREFSYTEMTMTVTGTSDYPSQISLTASSTVAE